MPKHSIYHLYNIYVQHQKDNLKLKHHISKLIYNTTDKGGPSLGANFSYSSVPHPFLYTTHTHHHPHLLFILTEYSSILKS